MWITVVLGKGCDEASMRCEKLCFTGDGASRRVGLEWSYGVGGRRTPLEAPSSEGGLRLWGDFQILVTGTRLPLDTLYGYGSHAHLPRTHHAAYNARAPVSRKV